MPNAMVVPNSPNPTFSPSKIAPMFHKSPSPSSSPRVFNVHHHLPKLSRPPSSSSLHLSPLPSRLRQLKTAFCNSDKDSSDHGLCSISGSVLKRKRPARIGIPMSSLSFTVESPKVAERMDVVEVEEEDFSVYCKRGRRATMEDRYSAIVDLRAESRQAFFGVFDGHGGEKAAEFAANNIDRNIVDRLTRGSEKEIKEAVKEGYLTTDTDFLKEDVRGGTCCVTALIRNHDLVVSNVGDCRAVMSRGGIAEALTSDHRPSRKDEKDRIETLGGYVDCSCGVWRINGSLAVSRGIGDQHLKQYVIAEPETRILRISSDCEFLILGSDGLWDKVSNQEAVDVARPLCIGADKPEPFSACKKLVDLSLRRGSTDDISVMIIQLDQFIS